ncbi:hypothetical protein ACFLQL_03685 [Verrucomicrobiota bacterium]
MLAFIKLCYIKWFGGEGQQITGATLFSNEYNKAEQFSKFSKLYNRSKQSVARVPVQDGNINEFISVAKSMYACNISVVALLDEFKSDRSMMSRLTKIKAHAPFVKHFELFNELPHMIDMYQGEKIHSLQSLIEKTNQYCNWIHGNIKYSTVITMAPYNSLDERKYSIWGGVTNTRILKDLILYTTADKVAIHLYKDSLGAELDALRLAKKINEWNDEAGNHAKGIWITETGVDRWSKHVGYFKKMLKLFNNIFDPEEILWYRHTIKNHNAEHNGFALEWQDVNLRSDLYNRLMK